MRQFNQLVFDEVIYADTSIHGGGSFQGTSYTSCEFDYLLGQYDQLAIQAITDDVTGTGLLSLNLSVIIETSCDGRNWIQKNLSLGPEINSPPNITGTTLLPWGHDDGQRPSYVFVRFRVDLTSASNPGSAHVMIHVTGRDSGGVTVRAASKSMYQYIPPPTRGSTPKERIQACIAEGYMPRDCLADEKSLAKEEKNAAKNAGKKK